MIVVPNSRRLYVAHTIFSASLQGATYRYEPKISGGWCHWLPWQPPLGASQCSMG